MSDSDTLRAKKHKFDFVSQADVSQICRMISDRVL
nr:MAG TPA: hypothetical protein [Caudoviricetes sp.]